MPGRSWTVTSQRPCLVWALALAVSIRSLNVSASPTPLRMQFTPGDERVYAFESTLRQETSTPQAELIHEMTLVGTTRQVVVALEGEGATALIGQLGMGHWTMTEGADRVPVGARDQTWCSAWRVDLRGRAIRRDAGGNVAPRNALRRALGQIGESPQICATFPDNDAASGLSWDGDVLLPLLGMRLPGHGQSTIVSLSREAQTRVCLIRSQVSCGSSQAHMDWVPDEWLPDTRVTGTTRGTFDLDRGMWLRTGMDLHAQLDGQDFEGKIHIVSSLVLTSTRKLAASDAAAWAARVKAFDVVLESLYAADGGSVVPLEVLRNAEPDPDWRKGLDLTLALVAKTCEGLAPTAAHADVRGAGSTPPVPDVFPDASALYREAGAHATAGRLDAAAEAYRRFLENTVSADTPGWMRVLARYRLGGIQERMGNAQEALSTYRATEAMDAADEYAAKLKKKAGEKADALSNP